MTTAPPQLPPSIASYMRLFLSRRRRIVALRAAGLALACALVWMIAACLFDRFLRFSPTARLAALAADLLILATIVLLPLLRLMRRSADWRTASADLEENHPGFGQRLQTVVSQTLERPEYRGSDQLLQHVLTEVGRQIEHDKTRRLLSWRPAAPTWIAAAAAILLLALLLPLPRLGMPRLLLRFLRPLAGIPAVTTTTIHVSPGSRSLVQGESLAVSATAQRLPDGNLDLLTSHDGKTWARNPMSPAGGDAFSSTLPSIERDVLYKVAGGDAESETYRVTVLRPPALADLRIHCNYPAYTSLPPKDSSARDGIIDELVGTEVTLSIIATEPLASATLKLGQQDLPTEASADPRTRQATFPIEKNLPLKLTMTSAGGLTASGPADMRIRAVPDAAPTVLLLQPDADLRLHPRDILWLEYRALDDFGIAELHAMAQVNGIKAQSLPIPLRGDPRRQEGHFRLDLAALRVQVGDVVSISLLGKDTNGRSVRSEPLRHILIAPRSVDMNAHLRMTELKQAEQLAAAMLQALQQAQKAMLEAQKPGPGVSDTDRLVALIQINRALANASEAGTLLHQTLLRAIARSDSADLATALAFAIDRTRVQTWTIEQLVAAFAAAAPGDIATGNRLLNATEQTKQLSLSLRVIADGERATTILAERRNLATPPPTQPADKAAAERRRETLERARQEMVWAINELKLDPNAPDLEQRLAQIAETAQVAVRAVKTIDFAPPAGEWSAAVRSADVPIRSGTLPVLPNLSDRLASASVAEALRPDTDSIRARDMQLASRAAERLGIRPATAPAHRQALTEYPAALADLQREHDLTRTPANVLPPQQSADIRKAAGIAREKMISWAAEPPEATLAHPPAPTTREKAIDEADSRALAASANTSRHEYDKARENDKAMSEALANAGEPPADRQPLDRAVNSAEKLDQLDREQNAIKDRTAAAAAANDPAAAADLERRQHELASNIARMDESHPDNPEDSREAATVALGEMQDKLASLPQQMTVAQEAAEAARKAAAQAEQADQGQRDAAGAPPDKRAAAQRAADQAKSAAAEAAKQLAQASRPLDAGSAAQAARQLRQFEPESSGAASAIEQQLVPALQQMQQALNSGDGPSIARTAAAVRQALEQTQLQLRQAQGQIMQKDPLVAAKWFAQAAQRALAERPPDYPKAQRHQESASMALSRAWENSVRQAAGQRLAMSPTFAPMLRPPSTGPGDLPTPDIGSRIPGLREWGFFPPRQPETLSAPVHESDPPAYQEALRVYFEALGKTPTEKPKK